MTVDGQESPVVTTVGDATTLDVEGKLYLGGLPSEYRARNIGNVSSKQRFLVFSVGPSLPLLWWLFVLWRNVFVFKLPCLGLELGHKMQTFGTTSLDCVLGLLPEAQPAFLLVSERTVPFPQAFSPSATQEKSSKFVFADKNALQSFLFSWFFIYYLFLTVMGLCCCPWALL